MSYNNDTQWLSTFTLAVTSRSNKIFANGRHQMEITVGVTPQDGEDITVEQLETIQLVTLDEAGNYQNVSGELQLHTERDERFDYHPDANAPDDASVLESASLHKIFYVSSTRPEELQDTLYAVITKDEDTRYVTQGGELDASVTVQSIEPTKLNRDGFGLLANYVNDEALRAAGVDCDIYYLYFSNPELLIRASTPLGASGGVAYFQNQLDISPSVDLDAEEGRAPTRYQNFYHYAYEVGEEKEFTTHDTAIPVNQVPGVMNFIRLKTTTDNAEADLHHEPSRWEIVDQYGNMHKIEMTQLNEGSALDFIVYE